MPAVELVGKWLRRSLGWPTGIGVALQGGGSHGAYSWGILDRLLEEPGLQIKALSGTSAGAMNAAACASGLIRGGREGAREALAAFWHAVAVEHGAAPPSLWERILGDEGVEPCASVNSLLALTRVFSPYELNPLNLNPLRRIVESQIDFEAIRKAAKPRVYITATRVQRGTQRVFSNPDFSPDALLASACLPTLHQAVEIGGEPYWDGGYTGNPVVYPLVEEANCGDVLILLLSPLERLTPVRRAKEILARATEISFNATFLREMQWLARHEARGRVRLLGRSHRFHLLLPDQGLAELSQLSKLKADWEFFQGLQRQGRAAAELWLQQHQRDVGVRSTVNLAETFAGA